MGGAAGCEHWGSWRKGARDEELENRSLREGARDEELKNRSWREGARI